MRSAISLQACLTLLLAFFVAPFQHVHTGGADHDHSATMHAHFYHLAPVREEHHGPELVDADDDDHAAVWSVDAFTLVLTHALALFVPSRVGVALCTRSVPIAWVEAVEECGHDPPLIDRSIPRAPPS